MHGCWQVAEAWRKANKLQEEVDKYKQELEAESADRKQESAAWKQQTDALKVCVCGFLRAVQRRVNVACL